MGTCKVSTSTVRTVHTLKVDSRVCTLTNVSSVSLSTHLGGKYLIHFSCKQFLHYHFILATFRPSNLFQNVDILVSKKGILPKNKYWCDQYRVMDWTTLGDGTIRNRVQAIHHIANYKIEH